MKKSVFVFVMSLIVIGCSGEDKNTSRIHHNHVSASMPAFELRKEVKNPCRDAIEKKALCASVLLKDGAPEPQYPLASADNLMTVAVYDPAFEPEAPSISYKIFFNCDVVKEQDAEDCIAVEKVNELLSRFITK